LTLHILFRATDEVDAELRQDVGRIVQRLRQVVDAAPDEHPERARIVPARALDDPPGTFRGLADAGRAGRFDRALFGDPAQRVGLGVTTRVTRQVPVIGRVPIDHVERVLAPPRPVRRRDDAFDVEGIGIQQEVDHGLVVVRVGPADVRGDEDARPLAGGRLPWRHRR
jgi:hypothetical protein